MWFEEPEVSFTGQTEHNHGLLYEVPVNIIFFNVAESFPKQFVFANNKVEALTVINNKIVFATDDENLGAAINISIDGY